MFAGPEARALPDAAAPLRALAAECAAPVETHAVLGPAAADDSSGAAAAYVDHSGAAHERYGLAGPGYYLVRPDGHVAFRAPSLDAAPLRAYPRRLVSGP